MVIWNWAPLKLQKMKASVYNNKTYFRKLDIICCYIIGKTCAQNKHVVFALDKFSAPL